MALNFLRHRQPPHGSLGRALQRLGPIFVKLGQYLSTRPDLLRPGVWEELLALTDRAPAAAIPDLGRLLSEDPASERLASLETEPVGAASLAQVYQGWTIDGDKVAVKVKRPQIDDDARASLNRIGAFARVIERIGLARGVSMTEVIAELRRCLDEELDFASELRSLTEIHTAAADCNEMRVPRPYPNLSGSRVITSEFLDGVAMSEVLKLKRSGDLPELSRLGIDLEILSRNLLSSILAQMFTFPIFHADIHPGNLLVLSNNVVGFIDFGLVDALEPGFKKHLINYLDAIIENDVDRMLAGVMGIVLQDETSDPDGFRSAFKSTNEAWARRRARTGSDVGTHEYMLSILRAARRHRLRLPSSILSVYRSLCTAEMLSEQLGAGTSLAVVGPPFFRRLRLDQLGETLRAEALLGRSLQLLEFGAEAPERLRTLLSDLADDSFVLRVETTESPRSRRRADLRAKLVSAAIAGVAIAVLLGGDALHPWWLRGLAWLLLIGIVAWMAALWRRLS